MKNIKIYLEEPRKFEIVKENIELAEDNHCIVKPIFMSICKADLKYYLGLREQTILKNKLPMVLIHEAIGIVEKSNSLLFKENDFVCLIPCERGNSTEYSYNNDYEKSVFRSSNSDGFMQKYIKMHDDNLLKLSELKPEYSALELCSVCSSAIFKLIRQGFDFSNKRIVLFGTGSLSYLMLKIIKTLFNCDITVIGNNVDKLEVFDIDNKILFKNIDKKQYNKYDLVIEMVGKNTGNIINSCIKILKPNGKILSLGVDEKDIKINMRSIIQKGIDIVTSHRSTVWDYYRFDLNKIDINNIVSNKIEIKSVNDIYKAFDTASNYQFKTIMDFTKFW